LTESYFAFQEARPVTPALLAETGESSSPKIAVDDVDDDVDGCDVDGCDVDGDCMGWRSKTEYARERKEEEEEGEEGG